LTKQQLGRCKTEIGLFSASAPAVQITFISAMNSELLQQVRVIDPVSGTDRLADVLIADGLIKLLSIKFLNVQIFRCEIVEDWF